MPKQEITMSEMFKGYSDYSKDEYNRIWKDSLIVIDANILLNFYRYSEDTRKMFFNILDKIKNRLWIPYQVGKEYFNNKNNVMISSYNEYDTMMAAIRKTFDEAKDVINKRKNNQLKCKSAIHEVLDTNLKKIEDLLSNEKNEKKPKFENNAIENHIIKIFDKCIGENFEEQEYEKVKKEGLRRFENKIPPGFKDSGKEENGDYYIFYSLIKKSQNEHKDIIFITDDVKEDWFNEYNGEKHGGRYELLNEFYKETGNLLLIYTSDGFVRSYNKNIENSVSDEKIINELVNIRNKEYLTESNNLISDNYFKLLKYYSNNLAYPFNTIDKEEIYSYLSSVVRKLDIPDYQRQKLDRRLNELKINNSLESYSPKLLDFIELVEEYKDRYTDKKYECHFLQIIKHNYIRLISELKNCKSNEKQKIIYAQIIDNAREHLKLIEKLPSKYSYNISDKLEKLLMILYDYRKYELNKMEVIEQIELLLNVED